MNDFVVKNQMVSRFPFMAKLRFNEKATMIHFDAGKVVDLPDEDLLFIEAGCLSMTGESQSNGTEILSLGKDALVGVERLFTASKPLNLIAATDGAAWQISKDSLTLLMREFPEVQHCCSRYLGVYIAQLRRQTICYRQHRDFGRAVTAILSTHLRCDNKLNMTQSSLGFRLDTSRGTVNRIASELASKNLIRYARGRIDIVQKSELEKLSCPCYEALVGDINSMIG